MRAKRILTCQRQVASGRSAAKPRRCDNSDPHGDCRAEYRLGDGLFGAQPNRCWAIPARVKAIGYRVTAEPSQPRRRATYPVTFSGWLCKPRITSAAYQLVHFPAAAPARVITVPGCAWAERVAVGEAGKEPGGPGYAHISCREVSGTTTVRARLTPAITGLQLPYTRRVQRGTGPTGCLSPPGCLAAGSDLCG